MLTQYCWWGSCISSTNHNTSNHSKGHHSCYPDEGGKRVQVCKISTKELESHDLIIDVISVDPKIVLFLIQWVIGAFGLLAQCRCFLEGSCSPPPAPPSPPTLLLHLVTGRIVQAWAAFVIVFSFLTIFSHVRVIWTGIRRGAVEHSFGYGWEVKVLDGAKQTYKLYTFFKLYSRWLSGLWKNLAIADVILDTTRPDCSVTPWVEMIMAWFPYKLLLI